MPEPHIGSERSGSTFGSIVFMLLGLIAWALHLTIIYSVQATICAFAPPAARPPTGLNIVEIVILAATLLAAAVALLPVVAPTATSGLLRTRSVEPDEGRFHRSVAAWIGVLSLAGILWGGMTAILLVPCASLR